MSEELAKVIASAVWGTPVGNEELAWNAAQESTRTSYNIAARAAQEFYGIPPSAEKGAVGKAVEVILYDCALCHQRNGGTCGPDNPPREDEGCERWAALKALGAEVDGG